MKTLITAALIATCATHASALSCMFGNTAMAYQQAEGNGTDFVPAIGVITWQKTPGVLNWGGGLGMQYEGQEYDVTARFVGDIIAPTGERIPIDEDVQVQTLCINGDCGYASADHEMLTFLHTTDAGRVMHAYPCQSYPTGFDEQSIKDVIECANGGACEAASTRG